MAFQSTRRASAQSPSRSYRTRASGSMTCSTMSPQSWSSHELTFSPSVLGTELPRAFICTRASLASADMVRGLLQVVMTKKSMIGVIAVRSSTTVSLPRNSSHVRAIWQASARLFSSRTFCLGVGGAVVAAAEVDGAAVVMVSIMGGVSVQSSKIGVYRKPWLGTV